MSAERGKARGMARAKGGRKRRTCWSYSAGEKPFTVRVFERAPGGMLYGVVWSHAERRQVKLSLGHRDQERARRYAEEEARKLRDGAQLLHGPTTVARVMALFLQHESPRRRSARGRREDVRRAAMWTRLLGARRVATLGKAEWDDFLRRRASGALDEHGHAVAESKRVPVGPSAVRADLKFARRVFNWACAWNTPDGATLLERSPWGTPGPGVKGRLVLPKNTAPRRPVRTYPEHVALLAVAERVLMRVRKGETVIERRPLLCTRSGARGESTYTVNVPYGRSYLLEVLELLEQTGRRVGAVLDLRYSDLVRRGSAIVAVRWRPVKHAEAAEEVPVSAETRATLERVLAERPGIGDLPLFPAFEDRRRPVAVRTVAAWLREAEGLAKVPHLDGGLFHPYRRKWATERKHLPDRDVAAVGGWKDLTTMKTSYQQSDPRTITAVINATEKLMERKA